MVGHGVDKHQYITRRADMFSVNIPHREYASERLYINSPTATLLVGYTVLELKAVEYTVNSCQRETSYTLEFIIYRTPHVFVSVLDDGHHMLSSLTFIHS